MWKAAFTGRSESAAGSSNPSIRRKKSGSSRRDSESVISSSSSRRVDDDGRKRKSGRSEGGSELGRSLTESALRSVDKDDGWEDEDRDNKGEERRRRKRREAESDRNGSGKEERKRESQTEKARGKSRAEDTINPRGSTRSIPSASNSSQFPGQSTSHDNTMSGALPTSDPAHQFPAQNPQTYSRPQLGPHRADTFGAAAEYYFDEGQSVATQPGVRPATPNMLVNPDLDHLQAASSEAHPAEDTGQGSAADFYDGKVSPVPFEPGKPPPKKKPQRQSSLIGKIGKTAVAATGFGVLKPKQGQSVMQHHVVGVGAESTFAAEEFSSIRVPSSSADPGASKLRRRDTAPATGGVNGEGREESFATPPRRTGTMQSSSSSSKGRREGYADSSSIPLYAAGSAGAAAYATSGGSGRGNRGPPPSYTAAGPSGPESSRGGMDFETTRGGMDFEATRGDMHYHEHRGPMTRLKDGLLNLISDPEDVRRMEEYTEYIGVCKYCFDPRSSPYEAPRRHHYHRRRDSFEDMRKRRSMERMRRQGSSEMLGGRVRVDKESRYYPSSSRHSGSRNDLIGAGLAAAGVAAGGAALFNDRKDFDDTYSIQSGHRASSAMRRRSRSSSRERRRRSSHGVIGGSGREEREEYVTVRTKDGKIEKRRVVQREQSDGRGGSVMGAVAGAALGAGAASAIASSSGRSERRRTEEGPEYDAWVRRNGERDRRESSEREGGGLFSTFFSPSQNERKLRRRSGREQQQRNKQRKGFFTFSNGSSSSSDADIAFGDGFSSRTNLPLRRKKSTISTSSNGRRRERRSSDEHLAATVAGIGATAAALAAAQKGQRISKRTSGVELGARREGRVSYQADDGRTEMVEGRDEEWEDELPSEEDASSIDHGLAFGESRLSRRESRESASSGEGGLGAWGWRWGGKDKRRERERESRRRRDEEVVHPMYPPRPDGRPDGSYIDAAGAGVLAGSVPDAAGRPIGRTESEFSTPQQPMQYVDPRPLSDAGSRHASMPGSFDQPPLTSRPGPAPIQHPRPIAPGSSPAFVQSPPPMEMADERPRPRRTVSSPTKAGFGLEDAALIGGAALATAGIIASTGRKSKDRDSNVRFGLTDEQQRKEDREKRRERDRAADEERRRADRTRALKEEAERHAKEEDARRREGEVLRRREEENRRAAEAEVERQRAEMDRESKRIGDRQRAEIERQQAAKREAEEQAELDRERERRERDEGYKKAYKVAFEEEEMRLADEARRQGQQVPDEAARDAGMEGTLRRQQARADAEVTAQDAGVDRTSRRAQARAQREAELQAEIEKKKRELEEHDRVMKSSDQEGRQNGRPSQSRDASYNSSFPSSAAAAVGATAGAVLAGAEFGRHREDDRERQREHDTYPEGRALDHPIEDTKPSYAAKQITPTEDEASGSPLMDDDVFDRDFFRRKRSDSEFNREANSVVDDLDARYQQPAQSQADFFAPKELLEQTSGGKTRVADANGDNEVQVYHAADEDIRAHFAREQPQSPSAGRSRHAPYGVPALNVISPTPPPSERGSVRGKGYMPSSPLVQARDAEEVVEERKQDAGGKRDRSRSISWGEDKTHVYDPPTPESFQEPGDYMHAKEIPAAAAAATVAGAALDEIVVEAGSPSSGIETKSYKAQVLPREEEGPPPPRPTGIPAFDVDEVEDIAPETPPIYRQPFYESVSDLGFGGFSRVDSPGTEGAPPVRGFVEGETDEPTPVEEKVPHVPGGFDEEDEEVSTPKASGDVREAVAGSADQQSSKDISAVEPEEAAWEPPLSKKDKKKGKKAAKRSSTIDSEPSEPSTPAVAEMELPASQGTEAGQEEPDDYFLSKKDKKKRDKALKRGVSDVSSPIVPETKRPEIAEDSTPTEVTASEADTPKLSKKEQKKREKEAKRQGFGDVADAALATAAVAGAAAVVSEGVSDEWDLPSKKTKKGKKKDRETERDVRDVEPAEETASPETPDTAGMPGGWEVENVDKGAERSAEVVDPFQYQVKDEPSVSSQEAEPGWSEFTDTKKSKKKKKQRDSGRFNEPAASSPLREGWSYDDYMGNTETTGAVEPGPADEASTAGGYQNGDVARANGAGTKGESTSEENDRADRTYDDDRRVSESPSRMSANGDASRSVASEPLLDRESRRRSKTDNAGYADDPDYYDDRSVAASEPADLYETGRKSKRRSKREDDDTASVTSSRSKREKGDVPAKEKKSGIFGLFSRKSSEGAPLSKTSSRSDDAPLSRTSTRESKDGEDDGSERKHRRRKHREGSVYDDNDDTRSVASESRHRHRSDQSRQDEDTPDSQRATRYDEDETRVDPEGRHRHHRHHDDDDNGERETEGGHKHHHRRKTDEDAYDSNDKSFLGDRVENLPPLPFSPPESPVLAAANPEQVAGKPVSAELETSPLGEDASTFTSQEHTDPARDREKASLPANEATSEDDFLAGDSAHTSEPSIGLPRGEHVELAAAEEAAPEIPVGHKQTDETEELPPLPPSRPESPTEHYETPQRPAPFVRPTSTTAVPLRFPFGHHPPPPKERSVSFTSPAPSTPASPVSTQKKARPSSSEIRPLYLVESTRKPAEIEDSLPSLPSSKPSSRASSVHGSDDWHSAAEDPPSPERERTLLSLDTDAAAAYRPEEDFLDSQQTTPKASEFPQTAFERPTRQAPQFYTWADFEQDERLHNVHSAVVDDGEPAQSRHTSDLSAQHQRDPETEAVVAPKEEDTESLPALPHSRPASPYELERPGYNKNRSAKGIAAAAMLGGAAVLAYEAHHKNDDSQAHENSRENGTTEFPHTGPLPAPLDMHEESDERLLGHSPQHPYEELEMQHTSQPTRELPAAQDSNRGTETSAFPTLDHIDTNVFEATERGLEEGGEASVPDEQSINPDRDRHLDPHRHNQPSPERSSGPAPADFAEHTLEASIDTNKAQLDDTEHAEKRTQLSDRNDHAASTERDFEIPAFEPSQDLIKPALPRAAQAADSTSDRRETVADDASVPSRKQSKKAKKNKKAISWQDLEETPVIPDPAEVAERELPQETELQVPEDVEIASHNQDALRNNDKKTNIPLASDIENREPSRLDAEEPVFVQAKQDDGLKSQESIAGGSSGSLWHSSAEVAPRVETGEPWETSPPMSRKQSKKDKKKNKRRQEEAEEAFEDAPEQLPATETHPPVTQAVLDVELTPSANVSREIDSQTHAAPSSGPDDEQGQLEQEQHERLEQANEHPETQGGPQDTTSLDDQSPAVAGPATRQTLDAETVQESVPAAFDREPEPATSLEQLDVQDEPEEFSWQPTSKKGKKGKKGKMSGPSTPTTLDVTSAPHEEPYKSQEQPNAHSAAQSVASTGRQSAIEALPIEDPAAEAPREVEQVQKAEPAALADEPEPTPSFEQPELEDFSWQPTPKKGKKAKKGNKSDALARSAFDVVPASQDVSVTEELVDSSAREMEPVLPETQDEDAFWTPLPGKKKGKKGKKSATSTPSAFDIASAPEDVPVEDGAAKDVASNAPEVEGVLQENQDEEAFWSPQPIKKKGKKGKKSGTSTPSAFDLASGPQESPVIDEDARGVEPSAPEAETALPEDQTDDAFWTSQPSKKKGKKSKKTGAAESVRVAASAADVAPVLVEEHEARDLPAVANIVESSQPLPETQTVNPEIIALPEDTQEPLHSGSNPEEPSRDDVGELGSKLEEFPSHEVLYQADPLEHHVSASSLHGLDERTTFPEAAEASHYDQFIAEALPAEPESVRGVTRASATYDVYPEEAFPADSDQFRSIAEDVESGGAPYHDPTPAQDLFPGSVEDQGEHTASADGTDASHTQQITAEPLPDKAEMVTENLTTAAIEEREPFSEPRDTNADDFWTEKPSKKKGKKGKKARFAALEDSVDASDSPTTDNQTFREQPQEEPPSGGADVSGDAESVESSRDWEQSLATGKKKKGKKGKRGMTLDAASDSPTPVPALTALTVEEPVTDLQRENLPSAERMAKEEELPPLPPSPVPEGITAENAGEILLARESSSPQHVDDRIVRNVAEPFQLESVGAPSTETDHHALIRPVESSMTSDRNLGTDQDVREDDGVVYTTSRELDPTQETPAAADDFGSFTVRQGKKGKKKGKKGSAFQVDDWPESPGEGSGTRVIDEPGPTEPYLSAAETLAGVAAGAAIVAGPSESRDDNEWSGFSGKKSKKGKRKAETSAFAAPVDEQEPDMTVNSEARSEVQSFDQQSPHRTSGDQTELDTINVVGPVDEDSLMTSLQQPGTVEQMLVSEEASAERVAWDAVPIKKSKKDKRKAKNNDPATFMDKPEAIEDDAGESTLTQPLLAETAPVTSEPSYGTEKTAAEEVQASVAEDGWPAMSTKRSKKEKRKGKKGGNSSPAWNNDEAAAESKRAYVEHGEELEDNTTDVAVIGLGDTIADSQPFKDESADAASRPELTSDPDYRDHLADAANAPLPEDDSADWQEPEEPMVNSKQHLLSTSNELERPAQSSGSAKDIDFAANLAAGLADSGFDPNLVIDDPGFHRRSSPPGTIAEADPEEGFSAAPSRKLKKNKKKNKKTWEMVEPEPEPELGPSSAPHTEAQEPSSSVAQPDTLDEALTQTLQGAGFDPAVLERATASDTGTPSNEISDHEPAHSFTTSKKRRKAKTSQAAETYDVPAKDFRVPGEWDDPERNQRLEDENLAGAKAGFDEQAASTQQTIQEAPKDTIEDRTPAWADTTDTAAQSEAVPTVDDSAGGLAVAGDRDLDVDEMDNAYRAFKQKERRKKKKKKATEQGMAGDSGHDAEQEGSASEKQQARDIRSRSTAEAQPHAAGRDNGHGLETNSTSQQNHAELPISPVSPSSQVQSVFPGLQRVKRRQPSVSVTSPTFPGETAVRSGPEGQYHTSEVSQSLPVAIGRTPLSDVIVGMESQNPMLARKNQPELTEEIQESYTQEQSGKESSLDEVIAGLESQSPAHNHDRQMDVADSGQRQAPPRDTASHPDIKEAGLMGLAAAGLGSNMHEQHSGAKRSVDLAEQDRDIATAQPQPAWSFAALDNGNTGTSASPVLDAKEHQPARDSGYQSLGSPSRKRQSGGSVHRDMPEIREMQSRESLRSRRSAEPLLINTDTGSEWNLNVPKKRTEYDIVPEVTHLRTPSRETPLEPTTKNRASYLFQSPPANLREVPEATGSAHTSDYFNAQSREASHDFEPHPIAPVSENANRAQFSPPPTGPHTLDSIPEERNASKRSKADSDVGGPEVIKAIRRTETPQAIRTSRERALSPPLRPSVAIPTQSRLRGSNPLSTDELINRLSWPAVDEEHGTVNIDRSLKRKPSKRAASEARSPSVLSNRSATSAGPQFRSPEELRSYSRTSNRSSTPTLRRIDRSQSGDLRAASRRGDAGSAVSFSSSTKTIPFEPPPTPPSNDEDVIASAAGVAAMDDVFQGYGDAGSQASPTRPPSVRKRQSMHIGELESRLDQLTAENRALQDAKVNAERTHEASNYQSDVNSQALREALEAREIQLREKEAEINQIRTMLEPMQEEVARLTEINDGLTEANRNLVDDTNGRYATLQEEHAHAHDQWQSTSRELDDLRQEHSRISSSLPSIIETQVANALADKNAEILRLREELDVATEQIRALQVQIQASKKSDFLTVRDEDYFDGACQKLCQHVQQWVLRFSKLSDNRICRLSADIKDEKLEARLDNAILDGSDVDKLLVDRVKRRDVFMSVVMTMVWEYVFTRYLFGMDREQRQKLKALEKILAEVGPPRAVAQWRATTLTLLSRRPDFARQCALDTEAVAHEIFGMLCSLLPPPSSAEQQLLASLQKVMGVAVDLSIEMRTQRAEYIMLPPLQPEYDTQGELVRQVHFNASLMNERSGMFSSNEGLEQERAVVKIVLFPLVVKKGDEVGEGEEEIVVCPAQVLVQNDNGKGKKVVRVMSGAMEIDDPRRSRQSLVSTAPGSTAF